MPEPKISPQYLAPSTGALQFLVLGAGVATTIASLIAVYYLNKADVNVMGWYIDYLLPAGAMLVGIAAGSGYGIASWFTGLKIQRSLLVTIVVLQLLAYGAAQYLLFVSYGPLHLGDDDRPLTFPQYYDYQATHFAWKQKNSDKVGEPLGEWGYFFKALEVAGFSLGALIVPAALFKKPYCENCRVYMRTRNIATVGASIPIRKVKKTDVAGQAKYSREQDESFATAGQRVKALSASGAAGDVEGYRTALAALAGSKRAVAKLPKRLAVKLTRCTRCDSAYLQTQLATGQGKKITIIDLERTELPPGFIIQVSP